MKSVTVTLDEETAACARVHAAERHVSLSRMIGELLREHREATHAYDEAMRRFLGKRPVRLKRTSARYATREQLHDRARLR